MYSSEALSERHLHLNNCGRQTLSASDTYTLRKNGRVDYHILYILSGVCYATICGKEYKVTQGCIALFPPNIPQEYRFYKKDKSESVWMHFTGVGCTDYLRELGLLDKSVFEVGKSAELMSAVDAMIRTKASGDSENDIVSDSYLYVVLAIMSRHIKYGGEKSKRYSEVAGVIDYMNKNYKTALPVSDYAKMCHLSKSRFEHVFKENTGTTPLGYLFRIRTMAAVNLLENTELRVSDIAEEVGFSDANYFTRIFKKHTGTSPTKYKSKLSDR